MRIALDIETVPVVDDPDFGEPSDWRVFAIVLGHEHTHGIDVDVLFRRGEGVAVEHELYTRSLDWIETRIGSDESCEILTYNGSNYDLPILEHRIDRLDNTLECGLSTRVNRLANRATHTDLLDMVIASQGYRMPIDDLLAMLMIDYDTVRWPDGRKVVGEDMLDVGPDILGGQIDDETLEVARRYAASDVRPLFRAHDVLDRRLEILDG